MKSGTGGARTKHLQKSLIKSTCVFIPRSYLYGQILFSLTLSFFSFTHLQFVVSQVRSN